MMIEKDVDLVEDVYRLWMRNKYKMILKIILCIWWVYKLSYKVVIERLLLKEY